jgi:hypothetical protein
MIKTPGYSRPSIHRRAQGTMVDFFALFDRSAGI